MRRWPRPAGLAGSDVDAVVEETLRAESVVVCWAMGITQHRNGVATIEEILNFLLLRGNIGKPGAGPCPVRGHSNVQGDRTMGTARERKALARAIRSWASAAGVPCPATGGIPLALQTAYFEGRSEVSA